MLALLCNLSEQDIWLLTTHNLLMRLTFLCCRLANVRKRADTGRFLGRRLYFPMVDYLDMPFSTFSDFLLCELEAATRGRNKSEL